MGDMISQDEMNELLAGMSDDNSGLEFDIIHDFLDDIRTYLGYYISDEELSFEYKDIKKASVNDIKQYAATEIASTVLNLTSLEGNPVLLFLTQYDAKNVVASVNGTDLSEVEDGPMTEIDLETYKSLIDAVVSPINMLINKFSRTIIPQAPEVAALENSNAISEKVDFEGSGYYQAEYVLNTSALNNVSFVFYFPEVLVSELEKMINIEGHQFLSGKVIEKPSSGSAATQSSEQSAPAQAQANSQVNNQGVNQQPMMNMQQPMMNMQQQFDPNMQFGNQMYQQPMNMQYNQMMQPVNNINAQNAEFQQLTYTDVIQQRENIGLIREVPLEVTVEMGRTVKKIKEILEFAPGTIIELDKIAGDAIDILANGKFIAKGEVVVIDENYGIRITEIIGKPELF